MLRLDFSVDILPALEVVSLFGLDIVEHLENILLIIHAFWNLAEFILNPIKIPIEFNQVQDNPVLVLAAHLREGNRIQLQRSEDIVQEFLRFENLLAKLFDILIVRLVCSFFAIDNQTSIRFDDDLTLGFPIFYDVIPVAGIGPGVTDRINNAGLAGPLLAGDLNAGPVQFGFGDSEQVLYFNFRCLRLAPPLWLMGF